MDIRGVVNNDNSRPLRFVLFFGLQLFSSNNISKCVSVFQRILITRDRRFMSCWNAKEKKNTELWGTEMPIRLEDLPLSTACTQYYTIRCTPSVDQLLLSVHVSGYLLFLLQFHAHTYMHSSQHIATR